jgi:transposase
LHSHYVRILQDLPAHGRAIQLHVRLGRFFCDWADCSRQTFAEQVPEFMMRHSRKTRRLIQALQHVGLVAGGEAGARLAAELSMPVSADALLRIMRQAPMPTAAGGCEACNEPRVLGVDDWAFHRGQRYGTILCDLELHRPIDLLPDRSAEGFAAWLREHPGIQIISRDRGGDYARGAALGAPHAKQVADRWHLIHNLIEAFQRALDRQHALLAEVSKQALADVSQPADRGVPAASGLCIADETAPPTMKLTRRLQLQEDRRTRQQSRYRQVKELQDQGLPLRKIAAQLQLSRCTVRRYANIEGFPSRASRPRTASPLDDYMEYLKRRWEEGCHTAAQLYQEVKERGFSGSRYMVRRRVAAWRDPGTVAPGHGLPQVKTQEQGWRPSARSVTWLLLKPDKARSVEQQAFLVALQQRWPELPENVTLIQEFRSVLCQHHAADLEAWVELAGVPPILPEIKRFAQNLRQDWAAVTEAVQQPWSNGQVEGQVNRLKMIKRQMYGRANFDLLRQRVLNTG